jgi:hypothetical protein
VVAIDKDLNFTGRSDDAGIEKTSARVLDQGCDLSHRSRRDRIAVDEQRVPPRRAQCPRRYTSEIHRGTRIHDREHDVALSNEPRNSAKIG